LSIRPKGSRNKFSYDEKTRFYKLINVLPLGRWSFRLTLDSCRPHWGGDGDPLDALLLMDEPAFHWMFGSIATAGRE